MLLELEGSVLSVSHCDHERTLVGLIRYCQLTFAWQVNTIELVKHVDKLFSLKTVVDRHDTHASLFKELHMGAWDVPGNAPICPLANHVLILVFGQIQITTEGLSQHANDRPL